MSDWQAGDIALCVSAEHNRAAIGCFFTVKVVVVGQCNGTAGVVGLRFIDPAPLEDHFWHHGYFVKITPGHKIEGSEVDQREPWKVGV